MRCTRDGMAVRDHIAVAAKQETITRHTNTNLTYPNTTNFCHMFKSTDTEIV